MISLEKEIDSNKTQLKLFQENKSLRDINKLRKIFHYMLIIKVSNIYKTQLT